MSRGLPGHDRGVSDPALPSGPLAPRLLKPLKAAFLELTRRCAVPVLRAGLGPAVATGIGGSLLLLRTRGRTSGELRETPLGYAVVDGSIVVMAGFGRRSGWFCNALGNDEVEVVLPGTVLRGAASEITDPQRRRDRAGSQGQPESGEHRGGNGCR